MAGHPGLFTRFGTYFFAILGGLLIAGGIVITLSENVPVGLACVFVGILLARFREIGRASRRLLLGAMAIFALSGIGSLLANAWYADDFCNTAHWKCSLGDAGLFASVFGAYIGLLVLAGALIAAIFEPGRPNAPAKARRAADR